MRRNIMKTQKQRTDKKNFYCDKKGKDVSLLQRFVEVNGTMHPITEWFCDMQNFCDNFDCPHNDFYK